MNRDILEVLKLSKKGSFGGDIPAHHMYGWFHYLFNHEYGRRAIPCVEKLIDSCIEYRRQNEKPEFPY